MLFLAKTMSQPAKKFDQLGPEAANDNNEAPVSERRPKTGFEVPANPVETAGRWATAAIGDIGTSTNIAAQYAERVGENEILVRVREEDQQAKQEVEQASAEVARFVSSPDADIPTDAASRQPVWETGVAAAPEIVAPPTGKEITLENMSNPVPGLVGVESKKGTWQTGESPAPKTVKLPESVLHPVASPETQMNVPREADDRKEYESILHDKIKLLDEAKKTPRDQRNQEQRIEFDILSNEVELMKQQMKRAELEDAIRVKDERLSEVDAQLVELVKQALVDNGERIAQVSLGARLHEMIRRLPGAEREDAWKLVDEQTNLQTSLKSDRTALAGVMTVLVGFDRALSKNKHELRDYHEAEERKADAERKRAEALRRQQEAEDAARVTVPSSKPSKFKQAAVAGLVGAGAGAGIGLFSVGKLFDWFDRGMKRLGEGDIVKTIQGVLGVPEKILDWIGKKMGIEDKGKQDKH